MSVLDAQGLPPGFAIRPDWEVTPRQLKAMLDGGEDFVLIDCRTPGEHAVANIRGAELVPLGQLAEKFPALEKRASQKTIVYCHHGVRSLQMAVILRQQGFKDVKSMAGGIDLWAIDVSRG